ncbi:MAG: hypothetical protein WC366_02465 [Bacilli bacterium]|jgi:hypothetical protein
MKLITKMLTKNVSEIQEEREVFLINQEDVTTALFPIHLFSSSLRFQIRVVQVKDNSLVISFESPLIKPFTKELTMNESYKTILLSFANDEISVELFLSSDESLSDEELILFTRHHIDRASKIKGYKLCEQTIFNERITSEKISKLSLPKNKSLITFHQLNNSECKSCYWVIGTRGDQFCYAIKKNAHATIHFLKLKENCSEDYMNGQTSTKRFIFEAY